MFSRLREPGGRFSLVVGGIACILLAALLVRLPLRGMNLILAALLAVYGLACFWRAWSADRADRYDLRKLFDAPPTEPEEPHLDHIPRGETSAPYCGWCDECYPPGTKRCRGCNREIG
jgi:hypothetical protein